MPRLESIPAFYEFVRSAFPDIATKANRKYFDEWDDPLPQFEYSWFHSLANALNVQMNRGVAPGNHLPLFTLISDALGDCSAEVRNCIDVSFVENLFWQVPADKAEGYWQQLPDPLKQLYLQFHRRAPA